MNDLGGGGGIPILYVVPDKPRILSICRPAHKTRASKEEEEAF